MSQSAEKKFSVGGRIGSVTGIHRVPVRSRSLFVFGHGAGAGARHPFMEAVAERLAERGVATFRYLFPYMQAGRKAPDRPAALMATVRAAVAEASRLSPDLPLIAGGKSMGGRMTSMAAAEAPLPGVLGLAFLGFPLHAAGKPGRERGAHLADIGLPTLFLQGTRDKLADLSLLGPVLESMRPPPTLHVVEGADHGFRVLKRSGRTDDGVLDELCDALASWVDTLV